MKRDMDFIRELLLKIERGESRFETLSTDDAHILGVTLDAPLSAEESERLIGHLDLLEQANFIEIESKGSAGLYCVKGLTWEGHDFLDSVRDPIVWKKTKEGALAAGGWTPDLLKDLAKGFMRKQIAERTGVEL